MLLKTVPVAIGASDGQRIGTEDGMSAVRERKEKVVGVNAILRSKRSEPDSWISLARVQVGAL